ncbi:uncharacterized protein LOC133718509 isoform X2 [Rosa rugosa]|uniref:uncharacterized protein LOC133718509 isoform X2 n=1 Tax=Rosa rugosa TaxID=74645 RepID=UPI002B417F70|nr:uncharacterized protein LOC133718509 isoform X2 [Rosa rugosa]
MGIAAKSWREEYAPETDNHPLSNPYPFNLMFQTSIGPSGSSTGHKCPACYKQYKKKEHLIEHKKVAFHSAHDPICGVCRKPCKSFESLRGHLTGVLPRYFNSEWSVAKFHLQEGLQHIVAFGKRKNTIMIIGMDGRK